MKTLRLILGDQLNEKHTWFRSVDPNIVYVLMEMRQETDYTLHHIQKIVGFFAAMRQFAKTLQDKKHSVIYLKISDKKNKHSLIENLQHILQKNKFEKFEYQLPDEYRLDEQLKNFCKQLSLLTEAFDTEHFFTSRTELKDFFAGKKQYLMESFYRAMRKKHDILMEDHKKPLGGKWNYDHDNRNPWKGNDPIPKPRFFSHSVSTILEDLHKQNVASLGMIEPESFIWPIDRKESLQLLNDFIKNLLPLFGKYQDAMHTDSWHLYHARLSFSLNTKMISPQEVIDRAIKAYEKDPQNISLSQVEGFVRQILGWREYMRGIYWMCMPKYRSLNFFRHKRKIPEYFWTGETKMNCLHHAIRQSLEHAYAHHIQRLMITGNFLLLAGIDPDQVDRWYLGIYIDAIEWVEITNTRGMSQFADGGVVATKPYISSANYIRKMSNYCQRCEYDPKKRTGKNACPFNSLYWHFLEKNRSQLQKNHRLFMPYKTLSQMDPADKKALMVQASEYLQKVDKL